MRAHVSPAPSPHFLGGPIDDRLLYMEPTYLPLYIEMPEIVIIQNKYDLKSIPAELPPCSSCRLPNWLSLTGSQWIMLHLQDLHFYLLLWPFCIEGQCVSWGLGQGGHYFSKGELLHISCVNCNRVITLPWRQKYNAHGTLHVQCTNVQGTLVVMHVRAQNSFSTLQICDFMLAGLVSQK